MSSPETSGGNLRSELNDTNRRPVPVPELSCNECRRRKSKCDREVPRCTLCKKHDRRCKYEGRSRPPITRLYVTELENRLAQLTATLQQSVPGFEDSGNEFNFSEPVPLASRASHSLEPSRSQPQLCGPISPGHERTAQRSASRFSIPLETSPSSGNWEWDERTNRPNNNKFVDGMASLTSDPNEGGYLGVASGAALLRVTDPTPNGSKDHPDSGQTKRPDRTNSSIPYTLTSLGHLEPFVESYFTIFHRSYPIVHEATFRAQFMEVIPRPEGNAWQVLLFVLAAIGAFTASTGPSTTDLGLFEAAKSRMSIDVLETGNIPLVQALTLISNYTQKRNKPNSGYSYMGLAKRTAMAIGLHKEVQSPGMSLFTQEIRRRIWHCLYIFDVGAIITFSRPLDFPQNGVDVDLPLNVHDTAITNGTKQMPSSVQETTVYTHLRAQVGFHKATSDIYSRIISTPFPSASDLIAADDQSIARWLSSLPAYFQENAPQEHRFRLCHSILRWRYRNFQTLMYRPILLRWVMARRDIAVTDNQEANSHQDIAIQRCLQAARESVELISAYWSSEHQNMMACWYGLYFLFQAVLIPIYCLRNDPQCPAAVEWREQILQAMRTIESMSNLNESASLCLVKIQSVCGPYLDISLDRWAGPTDESPQTQIANLYSLMWPTLDIAQMDGLDSSLQSSTIMDFMNQIPEMEFS